MSERRKEAERADRLPSGRLSEPAGTHRMPIILLELQITQNEPYKYGTYYKPKCNKKALIMTPAGDINFQDL